MNDATYKGHAGEGGLQNHSIGGCYPYTVYGQETPQGLRYGVLNCATGVESGALYTCEQAWQLASDIKALQRAGVKTA